MQIIIDLDGTICSEEKTFSRSLAKPKKDAVETINAWYDEATPLSFIPPEHGWNLK